MAKRANRLFPRSISAVHLFGAGMLCLPAYLFQDTLSVRIAEVCLFGALAWIAGKKIRWWYFVLMVVSITFFNLFTPIGQVLVRVGPVTVTTGALQAGLMKGFTIVGLVFLSLFSIRADLRLPGRLGALIGLVFYYYERIFEGRRRIDLRNIIPSIDGILSELYLPAAGESRQAAEDRRPAADESPAGGVPGAADEPTAPGDRAGAGFRSIAGEPETAREAESVATGPAGAVFAVALLAVMWTSLFLL